MLALSRFIPQGTASLKQAKWEKKSFRGREVGGKTMGVVGLGQIGAIVARLARGLNMSVGRLRPLAAGPRRRPNWRE